MKQHKLRKAGYYMYYTHCEQDRFCLHSADRQRAANRTFAAARKRHGWRIEGGRVNYESINLNALQNHPAKL